MNKKLVSLMIVVIVLIAIIVIAAFIMYNSSTVKKCDYNDPTKSYVKKEKNCVINFLCTSDRQPFSDECGCGCKLKMT